MTYYRSSSRGRGYTPRSSYRGGNGRGTRGSYRGYYDGNESRSYSGSMRYSSSNRNEEFRKPYRVESRDNYRGSPDRKRSRTDGPGGRYENSYGSGGGSNRYGDSSNFHHSTPLEHRNRSYGSDHRHSSGGGMNSYPNSRSNFNNSRSDGYYRPRNDSGGSTTRYRGGYKGSSSGAPFRPLMSRRRGVLPPRRVGVLSSMRDSRRVLSNKSYSIRKRFASSNGDDYQRKLKISKLRSAIAARTKGTSSPTSSKNEDEEQVDNAADASEKNNTTDNEEADNAGENGTTGNETESQKPVKEERGEESGDENDKTATSARLKRKIPNYINLKCIHCGVKTMLFRHYEVHLQSRTHLAAMRRVAFKQKSILSQMRSAQRIEQNKIDEENREDETPTNYCLICKLNYKQRKTVHQTSETHKKMKRFLMPYCKTCNATFKSPMMYEHHLCSIDHMKLKQRREKLEGSKAEKTDDVELENFTTIDSVGDDQEAASEEDNSDGSEPINVGIEQIRKVESYYCDLCRMFLPRASGEDEVKLVLAKHCRNRIHMHRYVRYKEDKELEKLASKLQRKEKAEKNSNSKDTTMNSATDQVISEQVNGDNEDSNANDLEDEANKNGDVECSELETKDGIVPKLNENVDDDEARDDKMWADVDKDLDDILGKEGKGSDEELE